MKDIKSLYLTAKSSGMQRDIDAYNEAVTDTLNNDPKGFLTNLEYIITSTMNCSRLDQFAEKYGISIAAYEPIVECLEACIERCEKKHISPVIYEEYLEKYQSYRDTYKNCFEMFEYYKDDSRGNMSYLENYYSINGKGIQLSRLPAHNFGTYGEMAIPDAIISAERLGKLDTLLQYVESLALDTTTIQWIIECMKDVKQEAPKSFTENSLQYVVESMKAKHNEVFRESMIMGDDNAQYTYTEAELESLYNYIAFKEYQMVCCENSDKIVELQKEIYSLYEEFDGLIDENDNLIGEDVASSILPMLPQAAHTDEVIDNKELFSEGTDPKKGYVKIIKSNINELMKELKKEFKKVAKEELKNFNKSDRKTEGLRRVSRPSIKIILGDKNGPFDFNKAGMNKKINNAMDGIKNSQKKVIDNLVLYASFLVVKKDFSLSSQVKATYGNLYEKIYQKAMQPFISSGKVSTTKAKSMYTPGWVNYYSWTFPIYITRECILQDVDTSVFESYNEFAKILSDTIYESDDMTEEIDADELDESLALANTTNKKTGSTPDYLGTNHDIGWGEDNGPKPKENDEEGSLEDYVRPSAKASEDQTDKQDDELPQDPDPTAVNPFTDKTPTSTTTALGTPPVPNQTNYYYYNTSYKDSNNEYRNSFNRDESQHDNHSTHSHTDDHSIHTNNSTHTTSNVRDNHSVHDSHDDNSSDKHTHSHNESFDPCRLDIFMIDETFTEKTGDADDNKPQSDHPIKDALTDVDRNLGKVQQGAKKGVQNVQNAGRAFMKPAKRTAQWVNNLIGKWKDKDENQIKEKMADPQARKGIFNTIGWCIKTGSLMKAGLLFNPIFMFLSLTKKRNLSKNQKRIRNEMIGEIKAELEIIDEKIKDTERVNPPDRNAKYKLMRLRNEINKKLVRVGGSVANKKWMKGEIV